ncbi:MAG: porin family protein [Pseudomonadota bacterium]
MKYQHWIAVGVAMAAASSAYAEEDVILTASGEGPAAYNFYVGVGIGQAKTRGTALTSASDTSFNVLGGYQFSKNFAAEIEMARLGQAEDATAEYKTLGWSFAGLGIYPINKTFQLYAKLGMGQTSTDVAPKPGSTVVSSRTYRSDLIYGLGAKVNLDRGTNLRIGWDRYKAGVTGLKSFDNYSVSVLFDF